MATKTIPNHILQAYLAQTPPDTEINMNTLATEIQEQGLSQALTFFSTLEECVKVKYIMLFYSYYYYALTDGGSVEGYDPIGYDNDFIHSVEDNFILPFNLDTTSLVAIRRLVSRLQKEVAKQRVYKKEEVVEVMSDNTNS